LRVGRGEFPSASDYLRDLIRHDKEQLEQLLVEGIESGKSKLLNLDSIRKKLYRFKIKCLRFIPEICGTFCDFP